MMSEIEELDSNSQQRREMFARYGLAMYHAQCVEKSLAILVSSVFNKDFLHSDLDRRADIQEEVFKKTIGRLLHRMRSQIAIPLNLDRTLNEAMQKRNWLAHDYFWVRAGEIMTSRGRNKIIDELTSLSDFFSMVDAHLVSIYEKWCDKIGVPQEVIQQNLKNLIQDNE
jgi:hypothetical protein